MQLDKQVMEAVGAALGQGKCVFVGEWRGYQPETINYTNKAGKPASFSRISHLVEVGSDNRVEGVKANESMPEGIDPKTVPVPFKKGQRVLLEVESVEVERGNKTLRVSKIHAI